MDVANVPGAASFLLRHLYLYELPGLVAIAGIGVVQKALNLEGLTHSLLPVKLLEGSLQVAAILLVAYLAGTVVDQIVRLWGRSWINYSSGAQIDFSKRLTSTLNNRGSESGKTLADLVLTEGEADLLRRGKLEKARFGELLDEAMTRLDMACKRKDRELFDHVTTPAELGMLFSANLSVSVFILGGALVGTSIRPIVEAFCAVATARPDLDQAIASLFLGIVALFSAVMLVNRSRSFWLRRVALSFLFMAKA